MSILFTHIFERDDLDAGHIALAEGDTQWTYGETRARVRQLARFLMNDKKLQPGDKVALMFMNQKEFVLGFFAVLLAGGVPVPINITMPPDDIRYVLFHSEAKLILADGNFAGKLKLAPIAKVFANLERASDKDKSAKDRLETAFDTPDEDRPFSAEATPGQMRILIYTSGTTGKPKGVMLSEENLLANLDGITRVFNFSATDKMLLALPLFHAYGLIINLYALRCGASVILVPNFSPKQILKDIVAHQATVLPLVPTMFSVLKNSIEKMGPEKFRSLRLCVSGGASLPRTLLKEVEALLDLVVLEGYGLSETSPVLCVNTPSVGSIPGSVGKPLPNVELQLVDEAGRRIEQKPGKESREGEIIAKGPNVMLGYFKDEAATRDAFDENGYLKTGDLGKFDADGNLFISGGRKKDLIIKAGENISPVRIEEILYQHPAVQAACVLGIPDEKTGEDILACVELKEGEVATEADLRKFCLEHLTPLLVPGQFRFYDELPKNATGKVVKKKIKEELLGNSPFAAIKKWLGQLIRQPGKAQKRSLNKTKS